MGHSGKVSKEHFRREYNTDFVSRWDEYIDWQKRSEAEDGFFQRLLSEHGARKVLDIACGTGFHTVTLAMDGFDVVGADGSTNMLSQAQENAARFGLNDIRFVEAEWTNLTRAFPEERFDAVICLGNAFTHLFDEGDRRKALAEIHTLLNDGGIAVIDQRNYDLILDKGYQSKHQSYYLGDTVTVSVDECNDQVVKFRYTYADGAVHFLTLCPIRQEYVSTLMKETGFRKVARYGDFQADYEMYEPDFVIQVAQK